MARGRWARVFVYFVAKQTQGCRPVARGLYRPARCLGWVQGDPSGSVNDGEGWSHEIRETHETWGFRTRPARAREPDVRGQSMARGFPRTQAMPNKVNAHGRLPSTGVASWAPGAGIPAGMRLVFARVSGGVVALLLNHRLQAAKPPASSRWGAEVSSNEAAGALAGMDAHPLPLHSGARPVANRRAGSPGPDSFSGKSSPWIKGSSP